MADGTTRLSASTVMAREVSALRSEVERLTARLSRPYYPLDDGWALTHLDTGQMFFVNTRDRNITPWIVMGGTWETEIEGAILNQLSAGSTLVDVGANMGYYSVKAAARVGPTGRVISFEPNPATLPFLRRNMAINGFADRSEIWPAAVGSVSGSATLSFSCGDEAQANIHGHGAADRTFTVDVQRLDEALAHIDRLDVLKIDAEGSEAEVLLGAQETLAKHDCTVVMELNLERWEARTPLSELASLARNRSISAVCGGGEMKSLPNMTALRDHLQACPFTESYVVLAR